MVTASRAVIAHHRRAPDGAGQTIRDSGHVIALERAVLTSFSDKAPCRTKVRRPPSAAAQAEAEKLRGRPETDVANRVVKHERAGVPVRAHTRSHPGSGRQLTIAGIIVILVWGLSEGGIKVQGEMKTPPPYRPASSAPAHPDGAR